VVFKRIFGGANAQPAGTNLTIEDLVVLERYDEAASRLKAKLKDNPDDLHSHLKLAEVYTELKSWEKAVDEYLYVAEEYASDGFYDKGIALLAKAKRCAPLNTELDAKAEKFRLAKEMERSRVLALEGMRAAGGATAALQVQRHWHRVAPSTLARSLPPEELKRLFSAMELRSIPGDELLAGEGTSEARLYFLVDGGIVATIPLGQGTTAVREFGPGDVVGEASLLEQKPWPATYRTSEPTKALVLDRAGLEKALLGNPDPRGLLGALRHQQNDRDVSASVQRLRKIS
jgi:tetratricopeptide (TPR) repeat protein